MNELMTRVATDPDYRAWAMSNPREFLTEAGVEVPDEVTVRVVEAQAGELVLTFPPLVQDAGALPDHALASVTGGALKPNADTIAANRAYLRAQMGMSWLPSWFPFP